MTCMAETAMASILIVEDDPKQLRLYSKGASRLSAHLRGHRHRRPGLARPNIRRT